MGDEPAFAQYMQPGALANNGYDAYLYERLAARNPQWAARLAQARQERYGAFADMMNQAKQMVGIPVMPPANPLNQYINSTIYPNNSRPAPIAPNWIGVRG